MASIVWIGRRPVAPKTLPVASLPPEVSASSAPPPVPSAFATTAAPRASAPPSTPATLPRTNPRQTLEVQLALLGTDRLEAFRSTFLPEIQPQITPEVFAACKGRVRDRAVRPDWEVAEDRVVLGRRVVSVSIFGKSMTGFVEVSPEEWRADAVWCLPPAP